MHSLTDQGSAGRTVTRACRGSGSRGCTTPGFPQTLASALCMSSTGKHSSRNIFTLNCSLISQSHVAIQIPVWLQNAKLFPGFRSHPCWTQMQVFLIWMRAEKKKKDLWLTLLSTGLVESTSYMVFSEMFWKEKKKKREIKGVLTLRLKQESYASDLYFRSTNHMTEL